MESVAVPATTNRRGRRLRLGAQLLLALTLAVSAVPVIVATAVPASAHEPGPTNYCTKAPDSVPGLYDFRHACAHHDACYGTHSQSRGGCDRSFRDDMYAECNARHRAWNPARYACREAADHYHAAVRLTGWWFYNNHSTSTAMS